MSTSYPRVSLFNTEDRKVYSSLVGREYQVAVSLPPSGFFVLYALFHQPDAFRCYLSGSGDLYIACDYMLAHDQALAARIKTDPIQVYISVGELESGNDPPFYDTTNNVPKYHELIAAIRDRNYPGVCLTAEIYEGEIHGPGGVAKTYIQGMICAFPPKK